LPLLPRRDAKGDGPMAPEGRILPTSPTTVGSRIERREIFAVIRDGAGPKFDMKGYKSKMSEQDMWNIVNYLRSLQAK